MITFSQQLKIALAKKVCKSLGYFPESLGLKGEIIIFQSYEDNKEIPGTRQKFINTIQDDLYQQLFHTMGHGDDLLHLDDYCIAGTGVKDGIVLGYASGGSGAVDAWEQLNSSLNSGGDGTETYIEIYGASNAALGAARTYQTVSLVKDFATDPPTSGSYYASKSISYTVQISRKAHVYYRISKPTGTLSD